MISLCALMVVLLTQAAHAQVRVGTFIGRDNLSSLGAEVLMVGDEAFAYAEDASGEARFMRWTVEMNSTEFQGDPGPLGAGSGQVILGRSDGGAYMAFGREVAMYGSRDVDNRWMMTRSTVGEPIVSMVRRTTFVSEVVPIAMAADAQYEIVPSELSVLTLAGPPLSVPDAPGMVRRASGLLMNLENSLVELDDGEENPLALPGAVFSNITEIDASASHVAVLDDGTAYLFDSAGDQVLSVPGANGLALAEGRFAVASDRMVQVYLRIGLAWCRGTRVDIWNVASMDFNEAATTLLVGVPTHTGTDPRLIAYGLNGFDDARCAAPLPGDGGAASLDGGAASLDGGASPLDGGAAPLDGGAAPLDGASTDDAGGLVDRSDLSCTCRVGGTAPSPLTLTSVALILGALLRRRGRSRRQIAKLGRTNEARCMCTLDGFVVRSLCKCRERAERTKHKG